MKYSNHYAHTQGGDNTVYVVPSNAVATVRAMTIHNPTAQNINVAVYVMPSNVATSSDEWRIVGKTLGADSSYLCPELANHVFTEGQKIIITGENVNVWLSISEI